MRVSLLAVAISSTVLAAGCFGGAYTVATSNDSQSIDVAEREIPWDGSSLLAVDVPSVVRFTQGPGPGKIVARGPHRSVSTLRVSQGHVHDELLHTGAVLELFITAPDVAHFQVNGRSRLTIEAFEQPKLHVESQGSAFVEVSGRTTDAYISTQGTGTVNLARLEVPNVQASLSG